MKKTRYLVVIAIFTFLVPLIIFIIQALKPLEPHFYQELVEFNGIYNVWKSVDKKGKEIDEIKRNMTFTFIDEYELSEMADAGNIKSISVIDEDDNPMPLKDWKLDSLFHPDFCIRKFTGDIYFEKEGTVKVKTLLIEFMDDINEYYSLGNLEFNFVPSDIYMDTSIIPVYNSPVFGKVKKLYAYSGVVLEYVPPRNEAIINEIIINDIDIGLKGFIADTDNISMVTVPENINNFHLLQNNLRKLDPPPDWFKPFYELKENTKAKENYPISLEIPPTEGPRDSRIICIPFICTDTDYLYTINSFSIKVNVIINGTEYTYLSGFEIPTLGRVNKK